MGECRISGMGACDAVSICTAARYSALDLLIAHELNQSNWLAAQKQANHQLSLDNWRETTHRQLMTIYWRQNKHNLALAQFEACRRVLAQELGVAPSSQTISLAKPD